MIAVLPVARWFLPVLGVLAAVIVAGAALLTGAAMRTHHRTPAKLQGRPGATPSPIQLITQGRPS